MKNGKKEENNLKNEIDSVIKDLNDTNANMDENELKNQINEIVKQVNGEENNEKSNNKENADVDYNKYQEKSDNIDYNDYDSKEAKENAKYDKKKINIVIIVMIVIIFLIFGSIIFNINNVKKQLDLNHIEIKDYDKNNIGINDSTFNLEKNCANVSFEIKEDYLGKKMLFINSNRDTDLIRVPVFIIYKANNEIISLEQEYVEYIPANDVVTAQLYTVPEYYDEYEIYFNEEEATQYLEYYEDTIFTNKGIGFSNLTKNQYDENFYIITNNTSQEIENVSYTILAYKGDELVFFEEEYDYELKEGIAEEKYCWIDEEIEYDEIKFVINYIRYK